MNGTRVKICGLTREADAALAAELGAWAIGFVFCDRSPRSVSHARARALVAATAGAPLRRVGVFVDEPIDGVRRAVEASGIDSIQLHGAESPAYCRALREALPETGLIKAFRFRAKEEAIRVAAYSGIEATLVDAYVAGQYGGTGVVGDWAIAKATRPYGPVILAGGLHAGNVRRALIEVAPYAVDLSSSVESAPGEKSREKLIEFFRNVRSLSEEIA